MPTYSTQTAAKKMLDVMKASKGMVVNVVCPDCDHDGPHDTNGDSYMPTALCGKCGYQWVLDN